MNVRVVTVICDDAAQGFSYGEVYLGNVWVSEYDADS